MNQGLLDPFVEAVESAKSSRVIESIRKSYSTGKITFITFLAETIRTSLAIEAIQLNFKDPAQLAALAADFEAGRFSDNESNEKTLQQQSKSSGNRTNRACIQSKT